MENLTEITSQLEVNSPTSSAKKLGPCWDYFIRTDAVKAQCKLCKTQTFVRYHGGTTNIWSHLRNYHIEENNIAEAKTTKHNNGRTSTPYALNMQSQPVVCHAQIMLLILNLIIKDFQPISIVEDEGFNDLIRAFSPTFKMPCRATIMSHLERKYQDESQKLSSALEEIGDIAVTTDGFKAKCSQDNYSTITAHFIDSDGASKTRVLETIPFGNDSHTGENIASKLKASFLKWNITNKIPVMVTDTAASQLKANRKLGYDSIPCSGHVLQLAIKDAFNSCSIITTLMTKCQNIVRKFKQSSPAMSSLRKAQISLNLPELRVLQNVNNISNKLQCQDLFYSIFLYSKGQNKMEQRLLHDSTSSRVKGAFNTINGRHRRIRTPDN